MALRSGANVKFFIGPAVSDETTADTLAEIAALTPYTQVKYIQNLAEYGDAVEYIRGVTLEDAREQSAKGIRTARDFTVVYYPNPSDDGQADLVAAGESNSLFACYVENNDKLTGGGTNSKDYFLAFVSPALRNPGDARTLQTHTATLGINSKIYTAAAT